MFTIEDIEKDIFEFEGIKIEIHTKDLMFSQKYSSFYENPLDGEATVAALKARYQKFVYECSVTTVH